jgi:hypothetical protein
MNGVIYLLAVSLTASVLAASDPAPHDQPITTPVKKEAPPVTVVLKPAPARLAYPARTETLTGTRIPREFRQYNMTTDSIVPVMVIDSRRINQSGATSVGQVLAGVPFGH